MTPNTRLRAAAPPPHAAEPQPEDQCMAEYLEEALGIEGICSIVPMAVAKAIYQLGYSDRAASQPTEGEE